MLQSCLVVIVAVISILSKQYLCQPPIQWPDPRHFNVHVDRTDGTTITAQWPVKAYCQQNTFFYLSIYARNKSGDVVGLWESSEERFTIRLKKLNAEFKLTGVMKSLFSPGGAESNVTITTGGKLAIN